MEVSGQKGPVMGGVQRLGGAASKGQHLQVSSVNL